MFKCVFHVWLDITVGETCVGGNLIVDSSLGRVNFSPCYELVINCVPFLTKITPWCPVGCLLSSSELVFACLYRSSG